MRHIIAIISSTGVLLFMLNYPICEYFYFDDIEKWWALKQNIYNIVIFIFQFLAFYYAKDVTIKTIMCFGFMICFSNIIDRLCFNVKTFQTNDIVMLVFAVILSTVFYYKNEKNGGGNKVIF